MPGGRPVDAPHGQRSLGGGAGRLRPRAVTAVLALLLAAAGAGTAASPARAHETGKLVVEPPVARPGDALTIHAEALWTEMAVTVALVDAAGTERPIATGATSDAGALEVSARVPDDLAPGTWEVLVENEAGEHVEGQVVVRAADPPILPIAAVLVLVLVVLVVAGILVRRRRTRQAATSSTS